MAIAEAGFDPQYGARPVKRAIQEKLLNELSRKIISGEIEKELKVKIEADATSSTLVFHQ